MSTAYFWHPRFELYQPERRTSSTPEGSKREQRTKRDVIRTTSEQYEHLRSSLDRREMLLSQLGKKTRVTRYAIFGLSMLYAAVVIVGPRALIQVSREWAAIPSLLVMCLIPFGTTYLVLQWTLFLSKRTTVRHECYLLEATLQRFGCPTGYQVLERFRSTRQYASRLKQFYRTNREIAEHLRMHRLARRGERLFDVFTAISVAATFVCSIWTLADWNGRPGQERGADRAVSATTPQASGGDLAGGSAIVTTGAVPQGGSGQGPATTGRANDASQSRAGEIKPRELGKAGRIFLLILLVSAMVTSLLAVYLYRKSRHVRNQFATRYIRHILEKPEDLPLWPPAAEAQVGSSPPVSE